MTLAEREPEKTMDSPDLELQAGSGPSGHNGHEPKEPTLAVDASKPPAWSAWLSSLRTKLIVPYVLLTMATAMVGMFVVTRLVASTLRERFVNQLLETSRVASDAIVRRERTHLEQLRVMTFTEGVGAALEQGDAVRLQELLFPIVLNGSVHSLTVSDPSGREVLSLVQDPTTGDYLVSHGADLSSLDLILMPLAGVEDSLGDKFAGLAQTVYGPYLLTSGPVRDDNGRILGALMVGTRLSTLATDLKTQVLADLVILDQQGALMATTMSEPEQGFDVLTLTSLEVAYLDPGKIDALVMYQRPYQIYYAPLVVRRAEVGVVGVVLPSNFIVTTESTSRNLFSLVFSLGTLAVIVVGYLLAQRISRPIMRMRDVSLAVASGDLDQRTGIRGRDEVGQMAAVFDLMTFRLRRRTAQAAQLHAETVRRSGELEEANIRLQQAQQQLVQSEKLAAVGQLTAGIVHDVKNPLAVIRGLTEEVQEQLGNDSPHTSQLQTIRDNATRANAIVSDLLKFARLSNPELRYQNLQDTVLSALRLTDYLARRGRVKIVTEPSAQPVMTVYDAQQIEQVLVNLIQNAIQAMPDGGTLRVRVGQTPEWVEVDVADTGVGIPAKNLGRIFDPFFTTKPPGEGTGLGLSVSYGLVAQHKGRIDVRSEVGKGSVFTLRLPRRAAA